MARAIAAFLPSLCILLVLGCSFDREQVCPAEQAHPEDQLAVVGRSNMEPVLLNQASQVSEQPTPPALRPLAHSYRAVPMRMCQCLSAQNASLAKMLDREREALEEKNDRTCNLFNRHEDEERELQMIVMWYSAQEIRNTTAGLALEGYFGLAGAEAKAELLQSGLSEITTAIQRTKDLRKQGLKPPVELDTLLKQQIDAELDQAQNQMLIYKLNVELLKAMEFDNGCDEWRIWPDPVGPLPADCPDVKQAIDVGLAHRPKLVLIREVIPRVNRHTIESARAMLKNVNALLGSSSTSVPAPGLAVLTKILVALPEAKAAAEVRAELQGYLHDEEKAVIAEIRLAATELQARRHVVQLARTRLQHVEDRLKELKQLQAQGLAGYAEQLAVNAEWYKARGELVKELLLWRVADVKLRQAQGLLIAECDCPDAP